MNSAARSSTLWRFSVPVRSSAALRAVLAAREDPPRKEFAAEPDEAAGFFTAPLEGGTLTADAAGTDVESASDEALSVAESCASDCVAAAASV
jgi:hypothetical protein